MKKIRDASRMISSNNRTWQAKGSTEKRDERRCAGGERENEMMGEEVDKDKEAS